MYLRRELMLISDNLSTETLNTDSQNQNAEKIIENTEKSLFELAESGSFSQSFLKFNQALIKLLKWQQWPCRVIKVSLEFPLD